MKRLPIVTATALMLAVTTVAYAEPPSPFDAYEGKKKAEPTERSTGQEGETSPAKTQEATATSDTTITGSDFEPMAKSGWTFGGDAVTSVTRSSNEIIDGGDSSNATTFARFSLAFGTFLIDRLELGVASGILIRRISRGGGEFSTSTDIPIQPRVRYYAPLSAKTYLFGSLAAGVYFGSSSHDLVLEEVEIQEKTNSLGFAGSVGAGASIFVSPRLQLQVLADLSYLTGRERVSSADDSFRVTTLNFGLGAGIQYHF